MRESKARVFDVMMLAICALIAAALCIGTLILPAREFSEAENRALAGKPAISARAILSGEYFEGLSSFFADGIMLREGFIRARAITELALGRQESGGVVLYADGEMSSRCLSASREQLLCNLAAIEGLSRRPTCVLVPRAIDVRGLSADAESEAAASIRREAYSAFAEGERLYCRLLECERGGEQTYYATDHHLTTYGAYVAYRVLGDALGYEPLPEESFLRAAVTEEFYGTAYSAAGLIAPRSDVIELWRYECDGQVRVTSESGEELPLYDGSRLVGKDKYAVFLGGNHGVIHVSLEDGRARQKLLLIKDSFANALIPFLAAHYDLTVVDPRYTEISVGALVEGGEYDEVLIFCGIDTLSTGTQLAKALLRPPQIS